MWKGAGGLSPPLGGGEGGDGDGGMVAGAGGVAGVG